MAERYADEDDDGEPRVTDLVPVMRLHLHAALMALDQALSKSWAEDMAERYRQGATTSKASPLTRTLDRAYSDLLQYLQEDEDVSENERIPSDSDLPERGQEPV